jgi:LuxR family maltose regulon positive regulatory protein
MKTMATQLLATKLFIPSPRAESVSRARLITHLNTCLSHKLTLVSAPAGYGKTTLLSEWAKSCACPVAWLTVDEGDNDPARLLEYLHAAFQNAGIQAAGPEPASPGLPDRLGPLINAISALSEPVVLIIDDYHLLASQAAHNCLTFLLDHQPDHLHIILATRADPPLALARLRGRGQLAEIRMEDLRFTEAEAVQLVHQVEGCQLSAQDVNTLTARTEGWAAGLQMAAAALQALQQTRDPTEASRFIQAFSGSNRYILDYLMEEVLANTSEAVRSFLYQTSILQNFTADLCAEMIGTQRITHAGAVAQRSAISPGQCQAILEQIEQANLFIIPLDPDRRWYRYHQLFSDLLQKRLEELAPESIPDLALRASQWFERQGLVEPAVEYALLSRNYRYAAGLLESNAESLLMRGELVNFSRWARALPEDELHAHPLLTVYYGFTLTFDGAAEETVENHLRQAEHHQPDRASMAAIMTLRSLLMVIRGETRAGLDLAKKAAIDLPPKFVFLGNYLHTNLAFTQLWSGNSVDAIRFLEDALEAGKKAKNLVFTPLVMRRLARLYIALGQLQKGSQYLEQALKITVNPDGDLLPHAGMILISRGGLKREWNDLDGAEKDIRKGIELLGQWGKVRLSDGYVALAETLQARGDWQAAREAMNQAAEKAHQTEEYEIDDVRVAYSQALLAIRQGDLTAAQEWASAAGLDNDPGPAARLSGDQPLPNPLRNYLRRAEYLVLARLRLAQGQPELALQTLEEILKLFEQEGWVGFILEAEILRALAYAARGERLACFRSLRRALELGQAGSYLRMFLDEGGPLRALLQHFQRDAGEDQKNLHTYMLHLTRCFSDQLTLEKTPPETHQPEPAASTARLIQVEALSQRELEVLRLLATYLTVPEIASRIGVSTSTVRTHIKHIYGKLDTHTRIEAVERARGSGLI